MKFNVGTVKNNDGKSHIYFHGIEAWDDFDMLLTLLKKENQCTVVNNQEMIYIRKAELEKSGVRFQLMQDDMLGNYLFTEDDKVVPFLEQLAQNVIDSVIQKLKAKGIH